MLGYRANLLGYRAVSSQEKNTPNYSFRQFETLVFYPILVKF